jgi:2-polyprenyl-6-methoxyphenol hydroxylase-like FAD-dependent oxidoreductase
LLKRVQALSNVDVLHGWDVAGLTADSTLAQVTGARLVSRERSPVQRGLAADLVVVATGRSGRVPAWLTGMGYAAPPVEEVAVDIKYASQHVRFPAGSVDVQAVVIGPTSGRPAGAAALKQEGGTWVVTLFGYAGHHPPTTRDAWLAFAESVLPGGLAAALRGAERVDDLHQHRFPANLKRRYDKLHRFPEGLLVTGDAMCSVNPIYGQGMTLAAMEASCLRETLRQGGDDLASRFFKAAAKPVGEAWRFAVGADLGMPPQVVPGPRPLPVRAVNNYMDRVLTAAERDPVMAWRFFTVTGFDEPTSTLFSPDTLRRIASDRRHHRRTGSSRLATAAGRGQSWP